MSTNIFHQWWQGYREANNIEKLQRELMSVLHDRSDLAERLVNQEKIKHPGQTESWYLDKVVYELGREV